MKSHSNMALNFNGKKLTSNQLSSGVWRVILEIEPEEIPADFKDAQPGSQWVFAVCRQGEEGEAIAAKQPEDAKKKRSFDDMPRSQQAALLCDRSDFQEFLSERQNILCVDSMKASSKNPGIRRMVGVEGDTGKNLGLDNNWSYNIIKQVGNYGEVFDRHLGEKTPVGLPRGLNKLWSKGGILYAPPVR